MKKYLKLFSFVILITSLLTACQFGSTDNDDKATKEKALLELVSNDTGITYLDLYVDTETDVQYFIYSDNSGDNGGAAICPRYNADGTLYTGQNKKESTVLEVIDSTSISYADVYRDTVTGVHYYIYADNAGDNGGASICVRYNTDGSLVCS